jgi:hypothetical protein
VGVPERRERSLRRRLPAEAAEWDLPKGGAGGRRASRKRVALGYDSILVLGSRGSRLPLIRDRDEIGKDVQKKNTPSRERGVLKRALSSSGGLLLERPEGP